MWAVVRVCDPLYAPLIFPVRLAGGDMIKRGGRCLSYWKQPALQSISVAQRASFPGADRRSVLTMVLPLCLSRRHRPTVLVRVQPGVIPLAGEQLRMRPVFDNAPLLNHQNGVRRAHSRQAMRNEEHRASPAHLGEVALDDGF